MMTLRSITQRLARHIATWLLMLALPLQAVAGYAPAQHCDEAPAAAHAAHDRVAVHHDHAAAPADAVTHDHHDGSEPAKSSAHSCCHHAVSGAISSGAPDMLEPPRAVATRVTLLNTLYFPELPQRPPRV